MSLVTESGEAMNNTAFTPYWYTEQLTKLKNNYTIVLLNSNSTIMLHFFRYRLFLTVLVFNTLSNISCTAPRKVIYLYNLKDTALLKNDSVAGKLRVAQVSFENQIQKNDQLWITVGGSNIADLIVLNSAIGVPSGAGVTNLLPGSTATGFMVEADGKVKLPYLGSVQAEGHSRLQFEAFLTEKLKDYTKNPVVNVRFLNYNFSVLGEVSKPGRFSMITERTTIFDALGMAGDITEMGKREKVLLIREVNGQREFARLNLLSKDIFTSPYFYLRTNDVIYIEPVKTRFIARTGVPQYIGIAAVGISLFITVINLIK